MHTVHRSSPSAGCLTRIGLTAEGIVHVRADHGHQPSARFWGPIFYAIVTLLLLFNNAPPSNGTGRLSFRCINKSNATRGYTGLVVRWTRIVQFHASPISFTFELVCTISREPFGEHVCGHGSPESPVGMNQTNPSKLVHPTICADAGRGPSTVQRPAGPLRDGRYSGYLNCHPCALWELQHSIEDKFTQPKTVQAAKRGQLARLGWFVHPLTVR
uniref:Uncharacterized protein n=1 Tax=Anopheles maculatus TaxID=74869 RepID=A0A182S791_9DIPT